MTVTNRTEEHEEIKVVGTYKAKFKTSFDKKDSDYIILDLSVTDDLKELIKKAIIDEKTECVMDDGTGNPMKMKRYKVKRWVYSRMYGNYKDVLFIEKLLNKGEIRLKLLSTEAVDGVIECTKENVKNLIHILVKYSNVDLTLTFGTTNARE